MSEYMKTYSVLEESGVSLSATLQEACEGIATWINSEFSDILTAECVTVNETNGYYRVEVYAKGSSTIGFYFGSYSSSNQAVCAGYILNGSCSGAGTANSASFLYFGTYTNSKGLSSLTLLNPAYLRLVLIKGDYGFAVDFTAPAGNTNKKVMHVVCDDGVTMVIADDKFYVEKNGVYYAPGVTLPPQSGANEKVLSRFALPKTGILPEHLYLSDKFVGSNNPYLLNGKAYTDVLFGSGTYMGFALELE
jgi:hypothetical protein